MDSTPQNVPPERPDEEAAVPAERPAEIPKGPEPIYEAPDFRLLGDPD